MTRTPSGWASMRAPAPSRAVRVGSRTSTTRSADAISPAPGDRLRVRSGRRRHPASRACRRASPPGRSRPPAPRPSRGRAGQVRGDRPLAGEELVRERGLADVGRPDDRDARRVKQPAEASVGQDRGWIRMLRPVLPRPGTPGESWLKVFAVCQSSHARLLREQHAQRQLRPAIGRCDRISPCSSFCRIDRVVGQRQPRRSTTSNPARRARSSIARMTHGPPCRFTSAALPPGCRTTTGSSMTRSPSVNSPWTHRPSRAGREKCARRNAPVAGPTSRTTAIAAPPGGRQESRAALAKSSILNPEREP